MERGLVHLRTDFHLYPAAGSMEWAVERWRGCLIVRCTNTEGVLDILPSP